MERAFKTSFDLYACSFNSSFVQIYNSILGSKNFLIFFIIGCTYSFCSCLFLLQNVFPNKTQHSRATLKAFHWKLYGTLWEDLNMSQTFSHYYYWLIALRGFVLAYVCVFWDMYPYFQIITVVVYQGGIVAIFLKGFQGIRLVFCGKNFQ